MLSVARILKPQGIKGELKLACELDSPEALCGFSEVYIAGACYAVETARVSGNDVIIKLNGVDDRNAAELFRARLVEIPSEKAPALPDGRYYITDLLGAELCDDRGASIGRLIDILQYGAADVYVVKDRNGKKFMFPALKKVLIRVDPAAKKIVVAADELQKVAVDAN